METGSKEASLRFAKDMQIDGLHKMIDKLLESGIFCGDGVEVYHEAKAHELIEKNCRRDASSV